MIESKKRSNLIESAKSKNVNKPERRPTCLPQASGRRRLEKRGMTDDAGARESRSLAHAQRARAGLHAARRCPGPRPRKLGPRSGTLAAHPRDPDPPRLSPVTKQRDALCSDAGFDDRRMPEAPVLRRNAV